ncbi:MAG TPA: hydrogenase maturation protease [Jatrophihabitantaceae bacterium]|nr:hydrogenase maturation protease [Jatrophihabitantaceae bacterium]
MNGGSAVVIGVGNEYRRDDGVGLAVLEELARHDLADVTLTVSDGEPTQLLDAWSGIALAVVVDAVLCEPSSPGRIHRTTLPAPQATGMSTHGLGIPDVLGLAEALQRAPQRLVVYAIEAADIGFGVGLSAAVQAAVPEVVSAVLREVSSGEH